MTVEGEPLEAGLRPQIGLRFLIFPGQPGDIIGGRQDLAQVGRAPPTARTDDEVGRRGRGEVGRNAHGTW